MKLRCDAGMRGSNDEWKVSFGLSSVSQQLTLSVVHSCDETRSSTRQGGQ